MAGGYLLCSKNSKKNNVAGAEHMEERFGEVITKGIILGFLFAKDFHMLFLCFLT